MPTFTFDQVRGPLERIILVALAWAAGKGYISSADVAGYATLVIGVLAAFYGWWQNRPKAILQSAAAIPAGEGKMTQIVTSPELAAATPDQGNIVSNVTNKVAPK